MKKEARNKKDNCCDVKVCSCNSTCGACGGGVYGLGFIGAAVYYISQATGFWMGVLGLLKALVWPAFLVYQVLRYINLV